MLLSNPLKPWTLQHRHTLLGMGELARPVKCGVARSQALIKQKLSSWLPVQFLHQGAGYGKAGKASLSLRWSLVASRRPYIASYSRRPNYPTERGQETLEGTGALHLKGSLHLGTFTRCAACDERSYERVVVALPLFYAAQPPCESPPEELSLIQDLPPVMA